MCATHQPDIFLGPLIINCLSPQDLQDGACIIFCGTVICVANNSKYLGARRRMFSARACGLTASVKPNRQPLKNLSTATAVRIPLRNNKYGFIYGFHCDHIYWHGKLFSVAFLSDDVKRWSTCQRTTQPVLAPSSPNGELRAQRKVLFCTYNSLYITTGPRSGSFMQSQTHRSLFSGTWQKRPRQQHHRLRFETEEMKRHMQ